MSDSANTYGNMLAMFKETYEKKALKTHERPGSNKTLFKNLKKKVKK